MGGEPRTWRDRRPGPPRQPAARRAGTGARSAAAHEPRLHGDGRAAPQLREREVGARPPPVPGWAELLQACRAFPMKQGRRITFEYVLLRGVNDADADAERLAKLIAGIPAKVNLIPYNDGPGLSFAAPEPARVEAFRDRLMRRNEI